MLKLRKNKSPQEAEAPRQDTQANAPQGISAQGNALRTLCAVALAVALVPTLLVFAYLLLLREPALERSQLDKVASAYGPTPTQADSLRAAESEFATARAELAGLVEEDVRRLHQDLDAAGVPWTPGRGAPRD